MVCSFFLAVILLREKQRNELTKATMDAHIYGIQIRVLLCQEDGEWVARALELDLLGYGESQEEAMAALREAVEAQISFAHQRNDVGLLPFPAEKEYFDRWEEAQHSALQSEIMGNQDRALQVRAAFICLTPDTLKSLRKRRVTRTVLECG